MCHPFVEKRVFSLNWTLVGVFTILGVGYAILPSLPTVEKDAASRECVNVLDPTSGQRIPNGCEKLEDYEKGGGRYHTVFIAPKYLRAEAEEEKFLPDVAAKPESH